MLPSIFHLSLQYTPESQRSLDSPATFTIRTFPYHFIALFNLTRDISVLDGVSSNNLDRSILKYCIEGFKNVTNPDGTIPNIEELLDILPLEITNDLIGFIFKLCMADDKFTEVLESSLHSVLNPRFQDESWGCEMCQKRRMDRSRNCPFLDKESHDPHVTYPIYGGSVSQCPIGTADASITNKAIEAFRYRKQSLLPEDGSIRNQTVFFMLASQKVEEIRNYYEEQAQNQALDN